jgi:SOS response associated peptidase (SRAP)
MKQRKRCIVICQGFYEWLKKGPGGKEKIPYFVKRKDGQLMCFAGLWDCVKYEDTEQKLYTYTIITTDPNKQLSFLHDRMPVILDAGSEAMKTWLNPETTKWSKELQSLLIPYQGELECYPVSKDVGKVGNNSPDFIVPINSKENKKNIANFFGNAKKDGNAKPKVEIEQDAAENSRTKSHESTKDNAPLPILEKEVISTGMKRARSPDGWEAFKSIKPKTPTKQVAKKSRSATKNEPSGKISSPAKKADGTQRITNFFNK